jgi:hypothetical protein
MKKDIQALELEKGAPLFTYEEIANALKALVQSKIKNKRRSNAFREFDLFYNPKKFSLLPVGMDGQTTIHVYETEEKKEAFLWGIYRLVNDFEKEKNDFLSSILSKKEDVPEQKKEVKTVENKERKLQLIENLKKAREQKKLNKQQPQSEQPKEIIKEQVKEVVKEDPEYLEWKKQRQQKQEVKQEVKQEPIKIQEVKSQPIDIPKPVIIPQPEYIVRSTFKKPLWAK